MWMLRLFELAFVVVALLLIASGLFEPALGVAVLLLLSRLL